MIDELPMNPDAKLVTINTTHNTKAFALEIMFATMNFEYDTPTIKMSDPINVCRR